MWSFTHTIWQGGLLELELADMKDNFMYRLIVFDHDLFIFKDFKLKHYPVIMITNPKPSNQIVPMHEPVDRIRDSTHIRILIFSLKNITSVTWTIDDGKFNGIARQTHVSRPLFVSQWDPHLLADGIHKIQVEVIDESGHRELVSQRFQLDKFSDRFDRESWILWIPWELLLKLGFFICYCTTMFGLIMAPRFHGLYLELKALNLDTEQVSYFTFSVALRRARLCLKNIWFRLVQLMTSDLIYYYIWFYVLCFPIAPWCFGYLTSRTDGWGYISLTGLRIGDEFISSLDTWAFGYFYYSIFFVPLIIYLSLYHDERWVLHKDSVSSPLHSKRRTFKVGSIALYFWIILHILTILLLMIYYTYWTLIISPFISWFLFVKLSLIRLYYKAFIRNVQSNLHEQ
jgi:hypothetical protein